MMMMMMMKIKGLFDFYEATQMLLDLFKIKRNLLPVIKLKTHSAIAIFDN